MNLLETIGRKIQIVREKRGITQEELEEKTGLNAKHISSIERGQKNATIKTLEKIAKGLEIELYTLLMVSDKLEPEPIMREAIGELIKEADVKTLHFCLEFLRKMGGLR